MGAVAPCAHAPIYLLIRAEDAGARLAAESLCGRGDAERVLPGGRGHHLKALARPGGDHESLGQDCDPLMRARPLEKMLSADR